MRNLMKFNRFVMPLLLIIFSALLHGCTLNENVSYKSASIVIQDSIPAILDKCKS